MSYKVEVQAYNRWFPAHNKYLQERRKAEAIFKRLEKEIDSSYLRIRKATRGDNINGFFMYMTSLALYIVSFSFVCAVWT